MIYRHSLWDAETLSEVDHIQVHGHHIRTQIRNPSDILVWFSSSTKIPTLGLNYD